MKRMFIYSVVSFFLLSGCSPVEDAPDVQGNTVEAITSAQPPPTQMEKATPTNSQPMPTETPTPTKSQPITVETVTPTASLPTPVAPFTPGSIGPGEQMAYSFQSSSGEEIIFWLYLPQGYDESRSWPLILSLHGFLGFEPSLEKVRGQSPLAWVSPDVEFPFIVISPQAPSGSWAKYHEPMDELIEFLGESLSIDPQAQFLTGLSAGAIGAWQWALAFPDRFAGVAPIAGGLSMNRNDPVPENICSLKDLPIWAAHSGADREAPIDSVLAAVSALEECGSTVIRFNVYTDLSHIDTISTAYAGPELYDWMLGLVR